MPKPEDKDLFGAQNPLAWVPDLVGKGFVSADSVLVVGSCYNGFLKGYSPRQCTMEARQYAECRDNRQNGLLNFQKEFFRAVAARDAAYYQPILRDLCGAADLNQDSVCLTDLCKASPVEIGGGTGDCRIDRGDDSTLRKHWAVWADYVSPPLNGNLPNPCEWSPTIPHYLRF